jgi:hypothetical protein
MAVVSATNSLSQARGLAAEGYIRWICEYDLCDGPHPVGWYLRDPDFVPPEPKWLRTRLEQHLGRRLEAMWREDVNEG